MITVIFTCDNCNEKTEYPGLRHGYVLPEFRDIDICRMCRPEALSLLKQKSKKKKIC